MRISITLISLCVGLAGCATYTQTTSGRSYLKRHNTSQATAYASDTKNIDEQIRRVAAVEPTLQFPARVGIARIDHGQLSTVPGSEVEAWQQMQESLKQEISELVPVNPLVAKMVAESIDINGDYGNKNVINEIRLGAARQHLDAVIIYEVYSKEGSDSNLLSIADLTIIGAYILPSNELNAEGFANAMLVDVIQGYPYGTVDVTVDKEETYASTVGTSSRMRELSDSVKTKAAVKLTKKVGEMFHRLRSELIEKKKLSSLETN